MNDQAVAAGPFAQAAGLLEDLTGARLTVKRVERAAEASGAAQAAALRERAAMITPGSRCRCRRPRSPDMLYGAIDGTGVTMTAKETARPRTRGWNVIPAGHNGQADDPRGGRSADQHRSLVS